MNTKECKECGKKFILNPGYIYKINNNNHKIIYYCSYSCWRKNGGGNSVYRAR